MKRFTTYIVVGLALCLCSGGAADGRGFGGFRGGFGGGFGGGGFGGGFHAGGFGGAYSGSRSFGGYSGWRGGGATSAYDRSFDTARGGSVSTEGVRGAGYSRFGGAAAGGM